MFLVECCTIDSGKRGGATEHSLESANLESFIEGLAKVGNEPFIARRMIAAEVYFTELSKYKFLVAPRGHGIQSPKFLEALLVTSHAMCSYCIYRPADAQFLD